MNISTTARHYELPPALKDYAEQKVENLKRYFDHIVNARIVFSLEKYRHRVEITIHVNGKDLVSFDESDDMYTSVDRSTEKLERQLRKYKDKIQRRKSQQGLSEVSAEAEAERQRVDEGEEE